MKKKEYLAKEYFQEAINQMHDKLSMFNLSNVLLDESELNYNDSISLLIRSAVQGFIPSAKLLCLLLIKKYKSPTLENIKDEFTKNNIESDDSIKNVFYNCKSFQYFFTDRGFKYEYRKLRETYYIYLFHGISTLQQLKDNKSQSIQIEKSKIRPINDQFYEGFGLTF